jgi:CRP/FNR family cyclic AMP-dependent transcriptional regulator
MEGLERIVREHPFFAGMKEEFTDLLSGCAKNVRFEAGQYLARAGDTSTEFYLLRAGRVALQIVAPDRAITIQTVNANEIVGASWLVPPYRWGLDAQALELTRAIALDAECLRNKCDADASVGYELMKRFMPIFSQRLQATRLQLLDIYGATPSRLRQTA